MAPADYAPAALCVCAMLRKATRTITHLYDDALRPAGLRATQFQTLAVINKAGEATVTELTRLLLIDQTTLTRTLTVLKRDGLLQDVQKTDGRLRSVKLTRKGARALEVAFPLWSKVQKQVTKSMTTAAWASISTDLERLARLSIG